MRFLSGSPYARGVTQRKPPGVQFETWIDRQIREARERGDFDGLPGAGKPIADIDEPHDELRWVRQKLKRENVSFLPPSLALRKEAEDARAAAVAAGSETDARRIVDEINKKIRAAIKYPLDGPPVTVMPIDADRVVAEWQAAHVAPPDPQPPTPSGPPSGAGAAPARRRSWWRRRPR